jgi:hypothetical protein
MLLTAALRYVEQRARAATYRNGCSKPTGGAGTLLYQPAFAGMLNACCAPSPARLLLDGYICDSLGRGGYDAHCTCCTRTFLTDFVLQQSGRACTSVGMASGLVFTAPASASDF